MCPVDQVLVNVICVNSVLKFLRHGNNFFQLSFLPFHWLDADIVMDLEPWTPESSQ